MAETGLHPEQIMKENLGQISSEGEIETAVDKVIADNGQAVEDYKKGKKLRLNS